MAKKRSGGRKASKLGVLGFTFIALILTLSTAFFLSEVFKKPQYNTLSLRSIVVAGKDINASDVLRKDFFKVMKWPTKSIPDQAFKSIEELFPANQKKPRVFINKIYKNEPVLAQRLSNPKQGTGFASLIPFGQESSYRGFPLVIDRKITKARLVYPGAVVDILTTMRRVEQRDTITKIVVQGVQVLAVNGIIEASELNQALKKGRGTTDVITLLVDADQGERLTLASREGQVDVLLRNSNDLEDVITDGVTSQDLTKTKEVEVAKVQSTPKKRKSRNRFRRSSRRSSRESKSRQRGNLRSQTIELTPNP